MASRISLSLLLLIGLRFTLFTVNTSSAYVTVSTNGARNSASAVGIQLPYQFGTVRCSCISGTLIVVTQILLIFE